jgi:2-succinyl-5-enolpyruvyl-6-hydroxy-3-cyclohexene-1-carboxylate synthase
VISQRGANGIDGLVSGAVGVAIAEARPVLAIVGDVSFVHDLNALTALGTLRSPLVIVVVDNGGGRIFESLPIARTPAMNDVMPLFTTPHRVDLASVTRAFGVACVETLDASETAKAVAAALARPVATVVRAMVDPHDARDAFAALIAAVDARLTGDAT